MNAERHIVIVGAGRTASRIIASLPVAWRITLVDPSETSLAPWMSGARPVTCVVGDASSRLVLAKAGLGPASTLVLATPDDAVNLEVARLAREEHGVDDIVGLVDGDAGAPLAAGAVDRADAAAAQLIERVGGLAVGAATGRGELVQVTVLAGSPAIGRPLHDLQRGDWLVAMVYRGSELVVPHGTTTVREGDRALIVGDPRELPAVTAFFRGGEPTFPAAWGARIGLADPAVRAAATWLVERTTASQIVDLPPELFHTTPPAELASRLRDLDVGCVVVPPRPISWFARVGLATSAWPGKLLAANVPVLVARGSVSPDGVLVAVGADTHSRAITGVGIDLARQASLPLSLLTVLPPSISPDADAANDVTADALRYARLHGIEPIRRLERGNPIERIRALTRPTDLLVVGHSPARRNTVFTPDISLFLLHLAPGPALFVPWAPAGSA